jgi:hypothetical protein
MRWHSCLCGTVLAALSSNPRRVDPPNVELSKNQTTELPETISSLEPDMAHRMLDIHRWL